MLDWVAKIFEEPELLRMGHLQRLDDANLGLGWLYYGLARVIRPTKVVVIGSYRGFVPLILAKALSENVEGGEVLFIDPSMVDDFWKHRRTVREYFAGFGVSNIRHFLMTTQQFAKTKTYRALDQVGMVFVDGFHSEEQARFDYETFEHLLDPAGVFLFHDSISRRISRIYGHDRPYEHRVRFFIDKLKQDARFQVFDLPFDAGVTLVRRVDAELIDRRANDARQARTVTRTRKKSKSTGSEKRAAAAKKKLQA